LQRALKAPRAFSRLRRRAISRPTLNERSAQQKEPAHVHTPTPTRASPWRTTLRVGLGLLAAVFVAFACYQLASRWDSSAVELRPGYVLAAAAPLALAVVILALGWKSLLQTMASRGVPLGAALSLHVESQIARYVPGKVGIPLMRMAGAYRLAVPAATVGYSVLLETISMLAAGGAVGCACVMLTAQGEGRVLRSLGVLGVAGVAGFSLLTLALVMIDRRRYPAWALRALHAEGGGALVAWQATLAHVAYWLAWACHGYLCARAVGIGHGPALAASGFYVLAPVIGFLALVAPSGIGVREALLAMALAPSVGAAPAAATAMLSRAISLAVDMAAWAAARSARPVPPRAQLDSRR